MSRVLMVLKARPCQPPDLASTHSFPVVYGEPGEAKPRLEVVSATSLDLAEHLRWLIAEYQRQDQPDSDVDLVVDPVAGVKRAQALWPCLARHWGDA
jgi:hypothetical protein